MTLNNNFNFSTSRGKIDNLLSKLNNAGVTFNVDGLDTKEKAAQTASEMDGVLTRLNDYANLSLNSDEKQTFNDLRNLFSLMGLSPEAFKFITGSDGVFQVGSDLDTVMRDGQLTSVDFNTNVLTAAGLSSAEAEKLTAFRAKEFSIESVKDTAFGAASRVDTEVDADTLKNYLKGKGFDVDDPAATIAPDKILKLGIERLAAGQQDLGKLLVTMVLGNPAKDGLILGSNSDGVFKASTFKDLFRTVTTGSGSSAVTKTILDKTSIQQALGITLTSTNFTLDGLTKFISDELPKGNDIRQQIADLRTLLNSATSDSQRTSLENQIATLRSSIPGAIKWSVAAGVAPSTTDNSTSNTTNTSTTTTTTTTTPPAATPAFDQTAFFSSLSNQITQLFTSLFNPILSLFSSFLKPQQPTYQPPPPQQSTGIQSLLARLFGGGGGYGGGGGGFFG